jgi:hypothetical protein
LQSHAFDWLRSDSDGKVNEPDLYCLERLSFRVVHSSKQDGRGVDETSAGRSK